MSNSEFRLSEILINLNQKGVLNYNPPDIQITYLLDSGTKEEITPLTGGIFQFTTALSQLQESALTSLSDPASTVNQAVKNQYFIKVNGYGILREQIAETSKQITDSVDQRTDNYQLRFLILFIISVVILSISSIAFYFSTIHVYRSNDRAMSMFGYIPVSEVEKLMERS